MPDVLAVRGTEEIHWAAWARVDKYSPDQTAHAVRVSGLAEPGAGVFRALFRAPEDGTAEAEGNLLVTVGLGQLTNLITGGGANAFSNANAIVGVGAGTAPAAIADTALTDDGTANAWYQQASSGYPIQSGGAITCVSAFGSSAANFTWQEWSWSIGGGGAITAGHQLSAVTSTPPVMLNHKVQGFGAKVGGSWIFTTVTALS